MSSSEVPSFMCHQQMGPLLLRKLGDPDSAHRELQVVKGARTAGPRAIRFKYANGGVSARRGERSRRGPDDGGVARSSRADDTHFANNQPELMHTISISAVGFLSLETVGSRSTAGPSTRLSQERISLQLAKAGLASALLGTGETKPKRAGLITVNNP